LRPDQFAAGWLIAGRSKITAHEPSTRIENSSQRREMYFAISNGLAMISWRELRFLQDFSTRDFTWLLIGALLAGVAMWVISRRRRRWL
jgi:LPXTG-motif cell wall-anchored protein